MKIALGVLICFPVLVRCIIGLPKVPDIPKLPKRDAPFQDVRTRLHRTHQDADEDSPEKYFHESTFHQHYDGRFADKKLNYDDRRKHLTALIQTYLSSMNDIGAETWIMHGSLLGWWWNRKILPWDSDLDVMVSEKSIHHLAQYYNMTVHHYQLPGLDEGRDYMLEVNPHYTNDSVESANKIDARWIDTDTGLFIDITTLRRNKTAQAQGIEGAMMVKDKHHYLYDDIFPLRETKFEGFPVKVPFAYSELLVEEYGERALTQMFFENHRFDPEKQEWVPLRYAADQHRLLPNGPLSHGTSYWGRRLPSDPG
ncbi:hypothetical protein LTR85_003467 [Meristemomyces frigidus]|nr:hypothetical protein LTR85_003467 [Meristemomyces frigidus]